MTDQGILRDIDVLDLSWGIAGPMTGMLLADHGARVTRVEPPDGDPFAGLSGTRVWLRGKRRATLDLHDDADRNAFLALARAADVVIESFAPGVAETLGIDHRTLLAANQLQYNQVSAEERRINLEKRDVAAAAPTPACVEDWERGTRASCTARSPATARRARTRTGRPTTRWWRHGPASSSRAGASWAPPSGGSPGCRSFPATPRPRDALSAPRARVRCSAASPG